MKHQTVAKTMGLFFLLATAAFGGETKIIRCIVDEHRNLLPGTPPTGWSYNDCGGNRGLLRDIATDADGVARYSRPTTHSYGAAIERLIGADQWEYAGMWYAIGHSKNESRNLNPNALFHPMILSAYQPRLVGVDIVVNGATSPAGRSDLQLKLEVKSYDEAGNEVSRGASNWVGRTELVQGPFPRTYSLLLEPAGIPSFGLVSWVLDRALPGDSIEVEGVYLKVETPVLDPDDEAFLFQFGLALNTYYQGLAQDRSNFPHGENENVSATGKLAKLIALASAKGMVDTALAKAEIVAIADKLLHVVPRGTGGLLPHFTKNGGGVIAPDTEWASGDTAYSILDLISALALIGGEESSINECIQLLKDINWAGLAREQGGFYHGYNQAGVLTPGWWQGFGMETIGVYAAALIGAGIHQDMGAPPDDNGSGFILMTSYPGVVPAGIDRWGNNWYTIRRNAATVQLDWWKNAPHKNDHIVALSLFGLSAAEDPDGGLSVAGNPQASNYHAYGTGGQSSQPLFTDPLGNDVVVGHYAGQVACLKPVEAAAAWQSMRTAELMTPLNNLESMSINRQTGEIVDINRLQGAWNLCLGAEGWALADPAIAKALNDAVRSVSALRQALDTLFPPTQAGGPPDFDSDGLSDQDESQQGTDFRNPDTDGDRLRDGIDPNPLIFTADVTAPIIELTPAEVNIEAKMPLPSLLVGVSAVDDFDGTITAAVTVTGAPDADVLGDYSIVYEVSDSAGHTASATRIYHVVDTTPPVITVSPSIVHYISGGERLDDLAGVSAFDSFDGDLISQLVVTIITVEEPAPFGTHMFPQYAVTDSSGNVAPVVYRRIYGSADSDGDLLPDLWETVHFGDLHFTGVDDPDGDGTQNIAELTAYSNPMSYTIHLDRGWNLISIGRLPADNTILAVFGDAVGSQVWTWDSHRRRFVTATTLSPVKGYWVYAPAARDIRITVP